MYSLKTFLQSKQNRLLIKKAGGFPLLARLIKSKNISLLIPVIGTLQECAAEKSYCMAIQAEGMVEDFVSNLLNDNMELRKHCASAIFKCAQEEETRALVKSNGGLEPLVALIKNPENHGNKELMAAVTGALWKLSMSEDNVKCFQELELVPVLIGLLKDNSEGLDDLQFNQGKIQVLTNIVGAIGESARTHENRELIREQEGLAPIIRLIASTSPGEISLRPLLHQVHPSRLACQRGGGHRSDGGGRGVTGAGCYQSLTMGPLATNRNTH